MPVVNPHPVVTVSREELPARYAEILEQNPLLMRVQSETRLAGWTDQEIVLFQLLLACASNASLKQRVQQLEADLSLLAGRPPPTIMKN